ncbi:MAG: hypothetical protein IM671_07530 [Phenylobacterium sp.]|uniref:hypothetical protein n=1 Tax=Phenylobacterium sp. TaxID=1871053 RepID=UPI0025D21CD2|nr:hypothetical protein [Phenylobacterium sp.]MCA6246558.1 hypothetical protein [Phenylobacterium sp.]
MARMPQGQPRPVPDPEGERYDEMLRQERLERARAEAAEASRPPGSVGHPELLESLIPVWGSGREAVADFQEGVYTGAALNGALAASDLFLASSLAKGVAKGGFYVVNAGAKTSAKKASKTTPYSWDDKVRPWMGKQGYLAKGQAGHHWAIPQNGWGKNVPEWLKNQPWNIKPMPEGPVGAEMHGRMTGRYKGKPKFNALEQYIYGTPAWSKTATGAAVGHPAAAAKAESEKRR